MFVSVCANDAAETRAAVTSSSSCHISQQGTTVNEFSVAGYYDRKVFVLQSFGLCSA